MLNTCVMYVDLPERVKGMTVRTFDGEECYTIVINSKLNMEQRLATYKHELEHYKDSDFDSAVPVDVIENIRHL